MIVAWSGALRGHLIKSFCRERNAALPSCGRVAECRRQRRFSRVLVFLRIFETAKSIARWRSGESGRRGVPTGLGQQLQRKTEVGRRKEEATSCRLSHSSRREVHAERHLIGGGAV